MFKAIVTASVSVLLLTLASAAGAAPKAMTYHQAMAAAKDTGAYGVERVKGGWGVISAEDSAKADLEAEVDSMLAPVLAMLAR